MNESKSLSAISLDRSKTIIEILAITLAGYIAVREFDVLKGATGTDVVASEPIVCRQADGSIRYSLGVTLTNTGSWPLTVRSFCMQRFVAASPTIAESTTATRLGKQMSHLETIGPQDVEVPLPANDSDSFVVVWRMDGADIQKPQALRTVFYKQAMGRNCKLKSVYQEVEKIDDVVAVNDVTVWPWSLSAIKDCGAERPSQPAVPTPCCGPVMTAGEIPVGANPLANPQTEKIRL